MQTRLTARALTLHRKHLKAFCQRTTPVLLAGVVFVTQRRFFIVSSLADATGLVEGRLGP